MKRGTARLLLSVLLSAPVSQAALAASEQLGLPGYLPDPEPLAQSTPQEVLRHLQADDTLFLTFKANDEVALVKSHTDFRASRWVFLTKGHWAYPSVIRL